MARKELFQVLDPAQALMLQEILHAINRHERNERGAPHEDVVKRNGILQLNQELVACQHYGRGKVYGEDRTGGCLWRGKE